MASEVSSGMIERIKAILLQPKAEWARIDPEPATVGGIMTRWVVPLAAIGPVAQFIGAMVFGYGFFGVTYRPPVGSALAAAVVSYLMTLAGVYIASLVINALAPNFGGQKDAVQAMKVAAYGSTAGFVGGIFAIIPALAILALLAGLYNLYLVYTGLPMLMRAPKDKAVGYVAVTVVVLIVILIVINAVVNAVTGALTRPVLPTY